MSAIQAAERSMKSCRREDIGNSGSRWQRSICSEVCGSVHRSAVVMTENGAGAGVDFFEGGEHKKQSQRYDVAFNVWVFAFRFNAKKTLRTLGG